LSSKVKADDPAPPPGEPAITPDYAPPFFLFNAHIETIFPALFRRVSVAYERERINTPDDDFLDLDWLRTSGSKNLVIIQHGLEGNTYRAYVKGMAKTFFTSGYDVLAWNFRGCSQEMNRKLRFYHSGATDDLEVVVAHADKRDYEAIFLIGFSLGGNLTLKYMGEKNVNPKIKKCIVFSVPVDLESSCKKISMISNRIYSYRFLKSLKNKIVAKSLLMPELDASGIRSVTTLIDFDNAYTAPLHGFDSAHDYYSKCSSISFIQNIKIPVLIVNTRNDPFLSTACFPHEQVRNNPLVKLEIPSRGGHVGFTQINKNGVYWSEQRALKWITGE
jgi:uncharacterized protein